MPDFTEIEKSANASARIWKSWRRIGSNNYLFNKIRLHVFKIREGENIFCEGEFIFREGVFSSS